MSARAAPLGTLPRRGFSLIDTMVALAVTAIVASVALPNYQQSVRKSRRADAVQALSAVLQAQERWRSQHDAYADDLTDLGLTAASPGERYELDLIGIGSPPAFVHGFEIRARPLPGAGQDKDAECSEMTIRLQGGRIIYLAANSDGADTTGRCWPR